MVLIIKHVAVEGPGFIQMILEEHGYDIEIVEVDQGVCVPVSLHGIEAVVIMGGPMNVYEEEKHPFLRAEDNFIRRALKQEIPLLGICLGGQLIAKAAGARIHKGQFREMGWQPIRFLDTARNDPLFRNLGADARVFQWHEDKFDIPARATRLAESSVCPQAFRIGTCAYGLQFHFEVTKEIIQEWIAYYMKDEVSRTAPDVCSMVAQSDQHFRLYEARARSVMDGFLAVIRGVRATA